MPHLNPDRALRRLVGDLASSHADDIVAILGALGPAERKAVEDLLREHATYFDATPALPSPPGEEKVDTSRLSPWLALRVAAVEGSVVTAAARETLRALTLELNATPVVPMMPPPKARRFFRRAALSESS